MHKVNQRLPAQTEAEALIIQNWCDFCLPTGVHLPQLYETKITDRALCRDCWTHLSSPACLFRPPGDPHEEVNLFPHMYGAVNWILDKYKFAQVSHVQPSILSSTAGLRCSPRHPALHLKPFRYHARILKNTWLSKWPNQWTL